MLNAKGLRAKRGISVHNAGVKRKRVEGLQGGRTYEQGDDSHRQIISNRELNVKRNKLNGNHGRLNGREQAARGEFEIGDLKFETTQARAAATCEG